MSESNVKKQIITYLIIVFAVSTIFYFLIPQQGGLNGGGDALVLPLMWTPALAALATVFIYQRNFYGLGWGLGETHLLLDSLLSAHPLCQYCLYRGLAVGFRASGYLGIWR